MNKPAYSLEGIKGRVESLEEDLHVAIAAKGDVTMTSGVIPEARYLLDRISALASGLGNKGVSKAVSEIDGRVKTLERKFASAVQIGKFVRLNTSVIADLRTLTEEVELMQECYAERRRETEMAMSGAASGETESVLLTPEK